MEDREIMVSVLVTFYNIEEYVDECLKSILSQKCDFQFEIVVGDDGSNDGTLKKIDAWRCKYPEIISRYVMARKPEEKCPGPVRASRNRLNLLKYVRGKYFLFLDGDDYYCDDNKLQKQVDILEAHPEYTACGHAINRLNRMTGESQIIPFDDKPFCKKLEEYWRKDYLHTDTILFRKADIDKIDVKLLRDEFNDNSITYAMLQNGVIYYIPEIMAVYRWTGTGIWTENHEIVNQLREMMAYEIELRISPRLKYMAAVRHYPQFKFFVLYRNNGAIMVSKDVLEQWKRVIEENDYKLTRGCYLKVVENKKLPFSVVVHFVRAFLCKGYLRLVKRN